MDLSIATIAALDCFQKDSSSINGNESRYLVRNTESRKMTPMRHTYVPLTFLCISSAKCVGTCNKVFTSSHPKINSVELLPLSGAHKILHTGFELHKLKCNRIGKWQHVLNALVTVHCISYEKYR